jgi:hypothetical protein
LVIFLEGGYAALEFLVWVCGHLDFHGLETDAKILEFIVIFAQLLLTAFVVRIVLSKVFEGRLTDEISCFEER